MNNKYIIDGVEYEYGEEVEVDDLTTTLWKKTIIFGIDSSKKYPIITEDGYYLKIRKIQPTLTQPTPSLSGRKATIILDGVEHTVTFE